MNQTFLIRADASVAMGTGHVMRCLALAQALQDVGGRPVFALAECSSLLRERLRTESIAISEIGASRGTVGDASETIALARQCAAAWIVVDGYQFGADYQQILKNAGSKILFLDDYGHASHYYADLILNQNVSADPSLYENRESHSRLLLGTQYCLLRREFASRREWKREIAAVGRKILITMGGSDPGNFTEKAMAALRALESDIEAVVVMGGSKAERDMPAGMLPANKHKIALLRDVSNMAELMAWADVAISAAGTTCWELCLMGLASLLIDVAPNQTQLAQRLDQQGCAIHLGNARDVSVEILAQQLKKLLNSGEARQRMSSLAREVVDGKGASRVVSAVHAASFRLRPAREDDCRLLWEWANEAQVRAASLSSAPIPWNTHVAWFTRKLSQEGCHLWIAEDGEGTPAGQVRFDRRADGDYEIAISLSRDQRGQGLAAPLIAQALASFSVSNGARIHAFVKPDNSASLKAFVRSGFQHLSLDIIHGQPAVHLVLEAVPQPEEDSRGISVLRKEHAS